MSKKSVYRIYFLYISKHEAKKLMTSSNLIDKKGILWFFNTTYYQRNKEVLLSNARDYQNDKERLREQARNKYRNLPEEKKQKLREQARNKYWNLPEEQK